MHLHLVIPDLVRPDGPRVPALELLVARGRQRIGPSAGLEHFLAAHFALVAAEHDGDEDDSGQPRAALPLAPYRLRGDGSAPGADPWICVDPVYLQVGIDSLALDATAAATLTAAEATALVEALGRHFAADGITLSAPHPARWYARLIALPDMRTSTPAAAAGRALDRALPEGPDGARWRAAITEAQMVLYEHPVNAAREAAGRVPLNSVWPWGAGVARALAARPRGERWFADDPLAIGLAQAADCAVQRVPERFGALAASAPGNGQAYVLLEAAEAAGDATAWARAIEAIERDWAAPALAALRERQIGMITLHAPAAHGTLEVETVAGDLRYFWRRRRPLADYLGRYSARDKRVSFAR